MEPGMHFTSHSFVSGSCTQIQLMSQFSYSALESNSSVWNSSSSWLSACRCNVINNIVSAKPKWNQRPDATFHQTKFKRSVCHVSLQGKLVSVTTGVIHGRLIFVSFDWSCFAAWMLSPSGKTSARVSHRCVAVSGSLAFEKKFLPKVVLSHTPFRIPDCPSYKASIDADSLGFEASLGEQPSGRNLSLFSLERSVRQIWTEMSGNCAENRTRWHVQPTICW